jgi:transposase
MSAEEGPAPDPEGVLLPPTVADRGSLLKAERRIAELERKIGRQQVELDFFQRALRQVRDVRQRSGRPGATASTRSSKR